MKNPKVYDSDGNMIGVFDGEYLYDLSGDISLRVNGNEVFTTNVPCSYIGTFEKNEAIALDGNLLFRIEE
ncbi:MAG: hypothetical protein EOO53_12200 [Gammaproteobacteria bacterium]|nr:MAG: hypothetical protein EOO53_12200 [Gammaproteobacteria bacterium]